MIDVLFMPFIIVYRIVRFPFLIIKYFFLGIYYIIKSVVEFIIFLPKKLFNKSAVKPDKKENKKEKNIRKQQEEQEKKSKELKGLLVKSYSHTFSHFINKTKEKINERFNNLQVVKNYKNKRDINRRALLMDFNAADSVRNDKKIRYKYLAKNEEGRITRGTFDAFSKLDVHSFLLSEGFEVYKIKEDKLSKFIGLQSESTSSKMSTKDLVFFLTQLSTYLKAGVTLVESVKILSRQGKNASRKKLFESIIYELTMGESFSQALFKQGKVFPRLLINMIETSEMTGQLASTLDNMVEYYSSMEKNRKQLITAMMYPSIIFVMAIAVVTFIMIWVIPQFVTIYASANAEIPGITMAVINLSSFLKDNLLYIAIGITFGIIIFYVAFRYVKPFKTLIQWILMHIPVIKNVIIYNEVTVFTKTFGSLLNHNVLIMNSMDILSRLTNNQIYKMMIEDTVANVGRGELLSKAFKGHWAFPETAYQMIVTGERTGQLGPMMIKVSEYYQEQQKNLVTQVKNFIEPIMISFMAVAVGGILLSVVLPMFNLYSSLE